MNVRRSTRSFRPRLAALLFWATLPATLVSGQGLLVVDASTEDANESSSSTSVESFSNRIPEDLFSVHHTDSTTLIWRNGEALEGELVGVEGNLLEWRTELFDSPLKLRMGVLESAEFRSAGYRLPVGDFRVVLTNGSVLTGGIAQVTDEHCLFASTRSGLVKLRLDAIVSLERLEGEGVVIPHPQALLLEEKLPNQRVPRHWRITPGGSIATSLFNQSIKRSISVPNQGLLSMSLHTEQGMQFAITLSDGNLSIDLGTWNDELILKSGSKFVSLLTFEPKTQHFEFELYWNAQEGEIAVHSKGERLGELQIEVAKNTDPTSSSPAATPQPQPGIGNLFNAVSGLFGGSRSAQKKHRSSTQSVLTIRHKGVGVYIDRCWLTAWSAEPLTERPPTSYALTPRGIEPGRLAEVREDQVTLTRPDGTPTTFPLNELLGFYWDRASHFQREPDAAEIVYRDGQMIRGTLNESDGLWHTDFAEAPLQAETADLITLRFSEPSSVEEISSPADEDARLVLEELDVISIAGKHLHGRTIFGGEPIPQFFPIGSPEPVTFSDSSDWVLSLVSPDEVSPAPTSELIHTTSKETIPVSLTGFDGQNLSFEAPGIEQKHLSGEHIRAVQFGGTRSHEVRFDGPHWRLLGRPRGPKATAENQGISLPPHASLGNPYAMESENAGFILKPQQGNGSIRVRLFTDGVKTHNQDLRFLIAHYGSNIYCGPEAENQSGHMAKNVELKANRRQAHIQFQTRDGHVEMTVDGVEAGRIPTGDRKRGIGLVIESTPVWGNSVGSVLLTDFSTELTSFSAGTTPYPSEAKREALLLPRLRRQPPPSHLLIGRNGDLLRGNINAMTSEQLDFQVGLESIRVPNDRLSAIVWLQPKEDDDIKVRNSPQPIEGQQWLDLVNGARIALKVKRWADDKVIGEHPVLGNCEFPVDQVHRVRLSPPSPTAAHTALADWRLEHTKDPVIPGEESSTSPLVGQEAPAFSLTSLSGGTVSLKDFKGKVLVLDFWATWCGPCVRSLPSLIETMATFSEEEVAFLTINQGEPEAQVRQFLEARRFEMAVLLDGNQATGNAYGVESIPNTIIIDQAGKVAFVKTGFSPDAANQIAQAVRRALSGEEDDSEADAK